MTNPHGMQTTCSLRSSSAMLFAVLLSTSAGAADWPAWRGVDGLGVSDEKNLPREWSESSNIAWKTALPGKGTSSPVVVGDRVYLTTQLESTALHVLCLDAKSGDMIWNREIARGTGAAHDLHNMSTPSVVADGEHVWAYFGTGDVACLNREGGVQWQRNLQKDYGKFGIQWGVGTSPIAIADRLVIAVMHQGDSYVVGLDPKSGETAWKVDREYGADDESQDSYSSPIICRSGSNAQLVIAGENHVDGYDPADGRRLWMQGGLDVEHPYGRTISGPTYADGKVIAVISGFQNRGKLLAINLPQSPDTKPTNAWEVKRYSPDCPTPVVCNGMVFVIRDDGIASSIDLETGEPYWQERLFSANVKVSPIAADGHVYFMNGLGECAVVPASKEFNVVHRNKLDGETVSTPAISGGAFFARVGNSLYCIR